MKIKTVAILGAGAVGSYMIWGLSQRQDIELGVIAEGHRAKYLQKGICINDQMYYPKVWSPQEAKHVDLLIVSLKYGSLKPALNTIKEVVGKETTVMSLMNGVDSEEIIGNVVGNEHVLPALIKVAARKEECYRFDPTTTIGIIFGERQEPFFSQRVQAITSLFENTGLHYRVTSCILEEIWSKFRLNVCNNLPQAILNAGVGCYKDSKHMQFIQEGLRNELETIARAKGIDLSKVDRSLTHGSEVPKWARYSTLQDLDAHRHSEIDMFSGAIIKMGKELNIPTPYNEYTYHMIKAIEEKNDGLFNYEEK